MGNMYSFKMGKNVLVGMCVSVNGNVLTLQLPSGKTVNRKAGNCTIFVQLLQPANPNNQPATVALPPKPTVVPQQQKIACTTHVMAKPFNNTMPMPQVIAPPLQPRKPQVYQLAKMQANMRKPNNGLTAIMAKIGSVPLPTLQLPSLRIVGMAFMALLLFVVLCGIIATATANNLPKAKRAMHSMVQPLHQWPINTSPWF